MKGIEEYKSNPELDKLQQCLEFWVFIDLDYELTLLMRLLILCFFDDISIDDSAQYFKGMLNESKKAFSDYTQLSPLEIYSLLMAFNSGYS